MSYFDQLSLAILHFQFIEEVLKQYLNLAYQIVEFRTRGVLPVRLSRDAIENRSLGGLIQEFSKFSDDAGLLDGLRRLNRLRNEIAHRGFLLTHEESADDARMQEYTERAAKIATAADGCVKDLLERCQRLADVLRRLRDTPPSSDAGSPSV